MVFTSLLFVYLFLPASLLFYGIARNIQTKNAILLIFSILFYSWGEPKYVLILLFMTFSNWVCSLLIEQAQSKKVAKWWMIAACIISLGLLGYFKYTNFVMLNLSELFHIPSILPKIALPIGISFYTFQILSYTVDVYRKEVPAQKNFFYLLTYVSLFHQCIAGPIVRYQDVSNELIHRKVDMHDVSLGVTRFTVGLGKKVLLANVCGSLADTILLPDKTASNLSLLQENIMALSAKPVMMLWLGVLVYMLQIYLDFSAYSDMAIGMGLMIGFHYKENFDYPYIADSVTGFWRRWHISLSSFFRDYVYIPLGGNRKGMTRTILNMAVVWLLTGFWHGASWNFVLWGLYFFVLLANEKLWLGEVLKKLPKAIGHVYLLLVVFFGWILFRFDNLELVWTTVKGLFGANQNAFWNFESSTLWLNNLIFILVAIVATTPLVKCCSAYMKKQALNNRSMTKVYGVLQVALPVCLMLLSTMALVGNSYNPFLYFQF